MRNTNLLLFVLLGFYAYSQQIKPTDTIYSNNTYLVSLYFDSPIIMGATGTKNFRFSYNKESAQNIGHLKAIRGVNSNLKVICQNGNIYNFIVGFKENLTQTDFFIKAKDAIGNTNGGIVLPEPKITKKEQDAIAQTTIEKSTIKSVKENDYYDSDLNYNTIEINQAGKKIVGEIYKRDPNKHYVIHSKYYLKSKPKIKRVLVSVDKVNLTLLNVFYNNNELYFVLKLNNKSLLDYDVNYVEFFLNTSKKTKNATSQRISYKPLLIYNKPTRVEAKEENIFVCVFNKFSIGSDKRIEVEINEIKGDRNLILRIQHDTINNPKH